MGVRVDQCRRYRVDAAKAVQVEVAHGVHAVDVLREALVARQEPGVLVAHEALVVRVGPQHVRPVGEAVAPRVRPGRHALRQLRSLPALVHEAHERALRTPPTATGSSRRRSQSLLRRELADRPVGRERVDARVEERTTRVAEAAPEATGEALFVRQHPLRHLAEVRRAAAEEAPREEHESDANESSEQQAAEASPRLVRVRPN